MGLADELGKLADLHRSGALTDAEYAAAKMRLIESTSTTSAVPQFVGGSESAGPPKDLGAPPKWMKPWGWFLVWLGALEFGASAYVNWRTDHEMTALLAGLLNPMFFIGMPIGLYWLTRSGVTVDGVLTAINISTLSEGGEAATGAVIAIPQSVWRV